MTVATVGQPASQATFERLRLFNLLMVVLHAVQGLVMVALSTDFSLPVRSNFYVFDEQAQMLVTRTETLFDLRLGPVVASFLFVSAAAHLIVSLPTVYPWYVRNLRRGINYARWYEYAISASIMIVVIAMLVGVYDIAALAALFGVNASMIFFGLMMELHNQTTNRVNWTAFVLGCIAGVVPWIVITLHLLAPGTDSFGDAPNFVYGIYASLFVFFNCFAINMWLQYRGIGPWRDYVFGERAYIVLSLTAKSALAWQVWFGTLRDI
jgi:hypothetical protein